MWPVQRDAWATLGEKTKKQKKVQSRSPRFYNPQKKEDRKKNDTSLDSEDEENDSDVPPLEEDEEEDEDMETRRGATLQRACGSPS